MYCSLPPILSGLKIFDNIIRLRDNDTRLLLETVRCDVAKAYAKYLDHSGNGASLAPINWTTEISEKLKENFNALNRRGSHYFLRGLILSSARRKFCQYCNARTADTLDHVLPRTVYPEFTVLPQNLVPACAQCNTKKGQACHWFLGKNFAHLYFVHLPKAPILFANVNVDASAVTIDFYLRQDKYINDTHFESLKNLFEHLNLGGLYQIYGISELSDHWAQMDDYYRNGGSNALKEYLEGEAAGARRSRGENYWKTACFRL